VMPRTAFCPRMSLFPLYGKQTVKIEPISSMGLSTLHFCGL
jgi:hypothetical protein